MSSPEARRRGRWLLKLGGAVVLLAAVAYATHVPLLTWVGRQLVHQDVLEPSDALLVLAGGVFDRELEAAELYASGMAPRVLMTAEPEPDVLSVLRQRHVRVESSLELRRRVLIELGVPQDRITILPGLVAATVHEAQVARQWAVESHARSLIVVTSSFHTARSRYVFRNVFDGLGVTLRFAPSRRSDFQPHTWWHRRHTLRDGVFELQRTLFYRLRY
jgi:uncharacterized SAM-binding protein YcdF (DUF218 family)